MNFKLPRRIGIDSEALIKDALKVMPQASRRLFLKRSLSLGGLSLLTGCSVVNEDNAEKVLMRVSRMNDAAQA